MSELTGSTFIVSLLAILLAALGRNKQRAVTFACYIPQSDKSEMRCSVLDVDSIPIAIDWV